MPVATTTEAARVVASNRRYTRDIAPINAEQAAAEMDQLFPERSAPAQAVTPAPVEKMANIQIEVAPDGIHVRAEYTGTLASIPAAIERLRSAGVLDLVAASATRPAAAAPIAAPDDLPEGWKLCQKHRAPMRPRNKQNQNWHSHNVGTKEHPVWCKGYKGADSPGYEL